MTPAERRGSAAAVVAGSDADTAAARRLRFLGTVSRSAGALAAAIGATFLLAWLLGAAARWSAAGALIMKTNMALALLLAGVALVLLGPADLSSRRRAAAGVLGAVVLAIGALTLCEHLLGWDLGIDQLLASEAPGAVGTVSPNRIGPPGCTSLTLLGAGLVLSAWRRPFAAHLGVATCAVVVVPLIGFVYGVSPFYSAASTAIAWPTVVALLALGLGLALSLREERNPLAILWRDDPGGELVRRLLVPAILIPIVVGYVRVHGERLGVYGGPIGTGLHTVALILLLSAAIWIGGRQLSASSALRQRAVDQRARAEAALRESEARFRTMADGTPLMIWSTDATGRIEFVNRACCEFFGTTQEGVEAEGWQPRVHPDDAPRYVGAFMASLASGTPFRAEARVRRADGEWRWIESFGQPRLAPDGRFVGMVLSSPDVTVRKGAEDALREADRRKTEFLAVLSHELRNPLAPIQNGVYILDRAVAGSEQAARAREVIRRQTAHLARLVDDLLDMMRISRGKVQVQRARIDLCDVLRKAMDDARAEFDRRGVELRLEHALKPAWIDGDAMRLAQVLGNLLDNAHKFTPAGGVVTVGMEAADGAVHVTVRDTGVGMVPGEEETMFEPFAQAQQGVARTRGGLGLGLSLARSLVELHGGSVVARSDGVGRGTELVVSLPLIEAGDAGERRAGGDGPAATPS